jgi:hypothetical protein
MKTSLAFATCFLLILSPLSHAADKFSGISSKLGDTEPTPLTGHPLDNLACTQLALSVVSGIWDSGKPAELTKTCSTLADLSTCKAAVDMITENHKTWSLTCNGPKTP